MGGGDDRRGAQISIAMGDVALGRLWGTGGGHALSAQYPPYISAWGDGNGLGRRHAPALRETAERRGDRSGICPTGNGDGLGRRHEGTKGEAAGHEGPALRGRGTATAWAGDTLLPYGKRPNGEGTDRASLVPGTGTVGGEGASAASYRSNKKNGDGLGRRHAPALRETGDGEVTDRASVLPGNGDSRVAGGELLPNRTTRTGGVWGGVSYLLNE